jgi:hypothetical protein
MVPFNWPINAFTIVNLKVEGQLRFSSPSIPTPSSINTIIVTVVLVKADSNLAISIVWESVLRGIRFKLIDDDSTRYNRIDSQ